MAIAEQILLGRAVGNYQNKPVYASTCAPIGTGYFMGRQVGNYLNKPVYTLGDCRSTAGDPVDTGYYIGRAVGNYLNQPIYAIACCDAGSAVVPPDSGSGSGGSGGGGGGGGGSELFPECCPGALFPETTHLTISIAPDVTPGTCAAMDGLVVTMSYMACLYAKYYDGSVGCVPGYVGAVTPTGYTCPIYFYAVCHPNEEFTDSTYWVLYIICGGDGTAGLSSGNPLQYGFYGYSISPTTDHGFTCDPISVDFAYSAFSLTVSDPPVCTCFDDCVFGDVGLIVLTE